MPTQEHGSEYTRPELRNEVRAYLEGLEQTDGVQHALQQLNERRLDGARVILEGQIVASKDKGGDRQAEDLLEKVKKDIW